MPIKKEIEKNPKLIIPFETSDIEELMNGETFKWTFTTDKGQDIDVLLRLEKSNDIEEDEPEDDNVPVEDEF